MGISLGKTEEGVPLPQQTHCFTGMYPLTGGTRLVCSDGLATSWCLKQAGPQPDGQRWSEAVLCEVSAASWSL